MKHILICGAGSVGIAVGASLRSQNMEVCFYARKETGIAIASEGITRTGLFGEIHIPAGDVQVVGDPAMLPDGWAQAVLICTKTLANAEIARILHANRKKLAPDFKIVILQNGWGNDRPFLQYFEKDRLYQARVITGFARTAPNISNVTVHTAPILFGSLYGCDTACVKPLADAVNASGIPSDTTEDLEAALWAKMLYNTTLNPLGAVLGVSYGKLAESDASRRIMDHLIEETYSVMCACGYHTFWDTPGEYKKEFYGKLVPDTYAHRSSTLQDIEKKQKTEIATLNGCIVLLAEEHHLAVPAHRMLCDLIGAIEDNYE